MVNDASAARRRLGRALSRAANASVADSLAFAAASPSGGHQAWRIGITGAPGAGKSTLIGRLARSRLDDMPDSGDAEALPELSVVAIDPSSPVSHGSILGDRIRMDEIAGDPRAYVRSLPSRGGRDGLTHNIVDVLAVLDAYGFREAIVETVGIGQAEHAVRLMVDTVVLVLHPEGGDSIQAMKAGVLEMADIYVVNKADLPGARRAVAELEGVLRHANTRGTEWTPPILSLSQNDPSGFDTLNACLDQHRGHILARDLRGTTATARRAYHVESLLLRRLGELGATARLAPSLPLADWYDAAIRALGDDGAVET